MATKLRKINLWRTEPLNNQVDSGANVFPLEHVFPSGRQALGQALFQAGLKRENRVAFPEWSSHCVISAIGRFCTPIPMTEVIKSNLEVDAVLVYEQSGWPIIESVMGQLKNRFESKVFILDMVDSAHFKIKPKPKQFKSFIQVTSLSKLLGLTGGGLALLNGKYLTFKSDKSAEIVMELFCRNGPIDRQPYGPHRDMLKGGLFARDHFLIDWLNNNGIVSAIEQERLARIANLESLLDSALSAGWPDWMKAAVKSGAGPGIAPLFRGGSVAILEKEKKQFRAKYGIETAIYHFNWSGNPLAPKYEKCLAFPVHGMVENIDDALRSIQ
ncbi:MAG: hypothetical protein HZA94_01815 [Candidatus Vogelbacteria bacterium]|nr:hypothetical protein [Candidatus Vogelbacteria bacterium]